jgi:hypothetical protein
MAKKGCKMAKKGYKMATWGRSQERKESIPEMRG